jgi:hypothetical protein
LRALGVVWFNFGMDGCCGWFGLDEELWLLGYDLANEWLGWLY